MKTVLPCIRDNPVVFVQFYDYWVDTGNCILSIITEKPGYESLANSLEERANTSQHELDDSNDSINSDDSNNSKNNREIAQNIFLRFSSLLRALELCQKFDPSILPTCFSSYTLYVNKEIASNALSFLCSSTLLCSNRLAFSATCLWNAFKTAQSPPLLLSCIPWVSACTRWLRIHGCMNVIPLPSCWD